MTPALTPEQVEALVGVLPTRLQFVHFHGRAVADLRRFCEEVHYPYEIKTLSDVLAMLVFFDEAFLHHLMRSDILREAKLQLQLRFERDVSVDHAVICSMGPRPTMNELIALVASTEQGELLRHIGSLSARSRSAYLTQIAQNSDLAEAIGVPCESSRVRARKASSRSSATEGAPMKRDS